MLKQLCKAFPPEASDCITQALIWRFLDVLSTIFNRTDHSKLESVVPLFGTIFKPMKFFA
jgi:hypothetical protein